MKITGVKIEKLLLELTSPFRVAFGTITHSENVMIKVTTDEGVTGYGEAAPLAFVTACLLYTSVFCPSCSTAR